MRGQARRRRLASNTIIAIAVLVAAFLVRQSTGQQQQQQDVRAVAEVRTGREFASALANASVRTVLIMSEQLAITDEDFAGLETPVAVKRNLTVRGRWADSTAWPLLGIYAVRKVRLGDKVELELTNVSLDILVTDTFIRSPGLTMLAATAAGAKAVFRFTDSSVFLAFCPEPDIASVYLNTLQRTPDVPGVNSFNAAVSQEGCTNSSTAPVWERCWPAGRGAFIDFALSSADVDSNSGNLKPNNYLFLARNVHYLCRTSLAQSCVSELGLYECMMATILTGRELLPPLILDARPASSPAPPPLAPSPAAQQAIGGGNGGNKDVDGGRLLAILLASILGGVTLMAIVVVSAFVCWKRRLHGQQQQQKERQQQSWLPSTASSLAQIVCVTGAGTRPVKGADCGSKRGPLETMTTAGASEHTSRNPRECTSSSSEGDSNAHLSAQPSTTQPSTAETAQQYRLPLDDVVGPGTPFRFELDINIAVSDPASPDLRLYDISTANTNTAAISADAPGAHGTAAHGSRVSDFGLGGSAAAGTAAAGQASDGCSTAVDSPVVHLLPVELGRGAYGRVVEGRYRGQRVAVKQLLTVHDNSAGYGDADALVKAFVQEVEVLGRCDHPNVTKLHAACLQPPKLALVMELMETSLDRVVYGRPGELLPLPKLLHIALQVCRGLEYLHPTIIHRDLKLANVLLNGADTERPAVKLADFGLSRIRTATLYTQQPEAGTAPYMAPECFDLGNEKLSHHMDMYSLGVLLWAMLTGKEPWKNHTIVAIAFKTSMKGERLPLQTLDLDRCPPKLTKLMVQCWQADPRRRPAAAEAVKELLLIQQQVSMSAAARSANPSSGLLEPSVKESSELEQA